jgi:plasmid stabilization system protein ParE
MSRIVKRPKAERDIEDVAVYIGQYNPKSADRFVDAVEEALELLAEMPELGGLCEFDETHLADVRMWTLRRFRKYNIRHVAILTPRLVELAICTLCCCHSAFSDQVPQIHVRHALEDSKLLNMEFGTPLALSSSEIQPLTNIKRCATWLSSSR